MRLTPFLLVACLLVAGCSGGKGGTKDEAGAAGDPGSEVDPAPGLALEPAANVTQGQPNVKLASFGVADCRNYGAVLSIPMATATALVPPGFTPVAATDPDREAAAVYAIIVDCASGHADAKALDGAGFAYIELAVNPPADLVVDGIGDCTMPLLFITDNAEMGAIVEALGMGLAGPGGSSVLTVGAQETGARTWSYELGAAGFELAMGDAAPDTLGVASGEFVLYGVQDGQVRSIVKGTASGDGAAHYLPLAFRSTGIPELAEAKPAALGFSASGFSLSFQQVPLPDAASA